MVGILLVTHGRFSEGVADGVRMLMGEQERFSTLCLTETDNIDAFRLRVEEQIDGLDDGDGVLVLVDVLGGSPFNTAACQLRERNIESVTGLNFPMVVGALEGRWNQESLVQLKERCIRTAREGIVDVRAYVEG